MIKKIALLLLLLVGLVLVYAATRPAAFRIERSTTINAPAAAIYPLIADFRRWPAWSPWEALDPQMTRRVSGAESGTGAIYEWEGNSDVGRGRVEILEAIEPSAVDIQLDFLEPWEAHNLTRFRLDAYGNATAVIWTMEGNNPYMMKLMGLFMDMDQLVGGDFERGLANLKAAAER
jgi:hypothetical protein